MTTKRITRDSIPAWYQLSFFDGEKKMIILRIHEDFLPTLERANDDSPIVKDFLSTFGFDFFSNDIKEGFGFEKTFLRTSDGDAGGFVDFAIPIPRVKVWEKTPCSHCEGSGKSEYGPGKCIFCEGKGKEHRMEWKKPYAISATFTLFTTLASIFGYESETSAKIPQLLTLQTITMKDMHGAEIGGELSPFVLEWIIEKAEQKEKDEFSIAPVEEALRNTYKRMMGGSSGYSERGIRSWGRKSGFIAIDCPGNATGIYTDGSDISYRKKGEGCTLSSHNVDSPIQQITLIAGLAKLHDLVLHKNAQV